MSINKERQPREHAGFDLLIEKLCLEGVNGIKPLLPDDRYGQDVALVAFIIDDLRERVAERDEQVAAAQRAVQWLQRLRARDLSWPRSL